MVIPLISILIPSYNYENYLGDCIRSIQNQTEENFEVLILDDGSTDGSYNLACSFARTDSRIRVWRQENAGIVVTLNRLFQKSRGLFVAQIDADDMYFSDHLSLGLKDLTQDENKVASFSSYICIDETNHFVGRSVHEHLRSVKGRDLMKHLTRRNCICASTSFIKTAILKSCGGFARDFSHAHDWDRWLRLSLHGTLSLRKDLGVLYRQHEHNHSKDTKTASKQRLDIYDELSAAIEKSYSFDRQQVMALRTQRSCLLNGYDEPRQALDKIIKKTENTELTEAEQVLLLQCLHSLNQEPHALSLAKILKKDISLLKSHNQTIVSEILLSLSCDLPT